MRTPGNTFHVSNPLKIAARVPPVRADRYTPARTFGPARRAGAKKPWTLCKLHIIQTLGALHPLTLASEALLQWSRRPVLLCTLDSQRLNYRPNSEILSCLCLAVLAQPAQQLQRSIHQGKGSVRRQVPEAQLDGQEKKCAQIKCSRKP